MVARAGLGLSVAKRRLHYVVALALVMRSLATFAPAVSAHFLRCAAPRFSAGTTGCIKPAKTNPKPSPPIIGLPAKTSKPASFCEDE